MAQWGSTTSESGILRKNKPKDNHDDLFVFGYACKLFRDDEKALYIDQGKHLIPWMGDDNLKIDRYDGRGALSDIKPYEASREGYDAMRWLGLNESERKIEQLCDKERYYALKINEDEEKMYKEEEEKRQKANQFQYSYDVPEQPSQQQTTEIGPTARENNEDDGDGEEVFVPPPQLDIPVDIEIPKTMKENARIEKTASFVYKQGPQMEILIKAKQADNPQFGFLNQGHKLYKYYRHILSAIKNGLYQVNSTLTNNKNDSKKDEDNGDDNNTNDHYLHPSLLSTTSLHTEDNHDVVNDDGVVHVDVQTTSIPTLPYKPSANCAYSQLVNRIQGTLNEQQQQQQQQQLVSTTTTTTMIDNKTVQMYGVPPKNQEAYSQLTYEQQQYYQYYYIAQYYEYYKQLAQYQQHGGQQVQPPEMHLDPAIQNYIQQMAYTQYLQQQQQQQQRNTNPYAQIVNNLSNLTNFQQQQQQETPTTTVEETRIVTMQSPKHESNNDTEFKKPLLSLAQYGSDSDNDNNNDDDDDNNSDNYKIPIGEIRIVIDKMASYVAKNGKQFEEIVKDKGDPRFQFLNETHDYYQYYRNKIKEIQNNNNNNNNNSEIREVKIVQVSPQKMKENRKIIAPVSFSIKKPKDDGPKEIKSALPIEESDDETVVENQVIAEKTNDHINNTVTPTIQIEINSNNNNSNNSNNNNNNEDSENRVIFDSDDPILEMIDLTDDLVDDQKRDIKRAEDRIKDKLAMAAREKLVSVNRDNRALQLERKRKAAAFLALKSAENQNVNNDENIKSTPNISGDGDAGGGGSSSSRVADLSQTKECSNSRSDQDDDDDNGDDDDDDDEDRDEDDERRFQRKRKSHKRKHSKSKHDSKSRRKSKKKRRRSSSDTSTNSRSS